MKDVILAVEKLSLSQFDPKQGTGTFKIHFRKDSEQQTFEKQYALSQPEPIVADILEEDNVDEKLFNFIARLCEKIKTMKHMKSHGEYMKLYDEIKIKELRLT